MKMRWPLTALAASALALLLPSPAVAVGLRVQEAAESAPAPAPMPAPSPVPAGPAPPPIRPGVVVRIVKDADELKAAFPPCPPAPAGPAPAPAPGPAPATCIRYDPLMEGLVGKDLVVKEMKYGAAGLSSPDGSQGNTWYFPLAVLKPWVETKDAKIPPVPGQAFRAVGLPTNPKFGLGPPGRRDLPWEYTIKHRGLMDPIAPPYTQRVDLESHNAHLPPYKKVQQVVSVECLEKLHKDPTFICDPEHYVGGQKVTLKSTTAKPLTQEEGKALKDKIKHLQKTIDSLSPDYKDESTQKMAKVTIKIPAADGISMIPSAVPEVAAKPDTRAKMKIGAKASDERLHSAGGYGEALGKK